MNKCYLIIALCLSISFSGNSQQLISAEQKGSVSATILEFLSGFPVENGIEYYNITYASIGSDGLPDTVSGLIVLPDLSSLENLPLVIYQHPTSQNKSDVPTAGFTGIGFFETAAFAAFGFIGISTDYLGLGVSRGFHPFIHAKTEAMQGHHMMLAAQEYLNTRNDVSWNGQDLFVSGYSQGGHASMALHQLLQNDADIPFEVTAASHMSGPYSVSTVMKERLLSDEPVSNIADAAYMILGINQVEHFYDSLTQIFKEPYAVEVSKFENAEISLDGLAAALTAKLSDLEGQVLPRLMFQDSFIVELEDPNSVTSILLRENDTYNWAPEAPTQLIYCKADERVPFENTILADSIMRMNGAENVVALNISNSSDHVACVPLALSVTIDFFKSNLVSVGVKDISLTNQFNVFPNPASGEIQIEIPENERIDELVIYNLQGAVQMRLINTDNNYIDLSSIESGMYLFKISSHSRTETHAIIIE